MRVGNIILHDWEIRALDIGHKSTITRPVTVVSPTESRRVRVDGKLWKVDPATERLLRYDAPTQQWFPHWQYGKEGNQLWVQETFCLESNFNIDSNDRYPPPFRDGRPVKWHSEEGDYPSFWQQPHYRATDPTPELDIGTDEPGVKWQPSSRMPRWASRFLLEIVHARVRTMEDMLKTSRFVEEGWVKHEIGDKKFPTAREAREEWIRQWDKRYEKKGFGSKTLPQTWVLSVKKVPSDDN